MSEIMAVTPLFGTGSLTAINAGQLALATVALFTNDIPVTGATPLAEYDAPTYAGYAEEALASSVPSISDDGTPELVYPVGEFRPTNAVTPNQIYGGLLKTAAGLLLAAWNFENRPVPMEDAQDAIVMVLRIRISPLGGLVVVIS